MTAPTHLAFAAAIGLLGGAPETAVALMAGGALLPDIDHPQSAIGRILFFVSIPLNKYAGHRKAVHGFALWGLVCLGGLVWEPLAWVGAGALTHVFLDCLNVSGVQALAPFSEKVCVLFGRNWRMATGSKHELFLFCALGLATWGGEYVSSAGGIRAMLGHLTGSYKIAHQQLRRTGLEVVIVEGSLRWPTGKTEEGSWLSIGTEGTGGVALKSADGSRLIHVPRDAELLKARLRKTGEKWETLALNGWARAESVFYFYDGARWRKAKPGQIVYGYILGRNIKIGGTGALPFETVAAPGLHVQGAGHGAP